MMALRMSSDDLKNRNSTHYDFGISAFNLDQSIKYM